MGCAASAPPPHQNGGVKHHNGQYPQHHHQQPPPQQPMHQQPPQQQPMHQPPPYQQAPPHLPPQQQPPRQYPPPPQQQHAPPQQQQPPPPPPQQQQPPPQQQPPTPRAPGGPPPSQPPSQPAIQEEDEAPPKPVEINQGVVDTLIDLEAKISTLERKNVIKQYELKSNQVNMLSQQVQGMVAKQQQLDAQTQKEYQDVVNLQNNQSVQQMMSQGQFAMQMNKEQEEYMQALNRGEIHKKELQATSRQLESLKESLQPVQKESEELKQLYDQQDNLLASIFNGKYGSEKEYKLESDLDLMMEKKQRISVAKYKWTQSRTLLSHAVNQMGFGVRRWNDAIQVPPQNAQLRYSCAAEARNNFVAALQNVASAQTYLSTIKFPYCTPSEMQTLNLAITHIFTDLLTVERHRHAMDCYVVVYKRSAALVQWFDFVISKTILKDHESAVKECGSLQKQLKAERMNLIKEKVREKLGDDAADKIEIKEDDKPPGEDDIEVTALAVIDADTVSQSGELAEMKTESTELANAPTPLSLEELAPAPNLDDIFGNIEQLKKEHEEQQKEYEKQQEVAKARADQGLQDKLAQRRSRRLRMQANQAETQALGGGTAQNGYFDMM